MDLLVSHTRAGSLLFQHLTCLTRMTPGSVPIDTKEIYQSACLFAGCADGLAACFLFVCSLPGSERGPWRFLSEPHTNSHELILHL